MYLKILMFSYSRRHLLYALAHSSTDVFPFFSFLVSIKFLNEMKTLLPMSVN